jgi:hypothetical protein
MRRKMKKILLILFVMIFILPPQAYGKDKCLIFFSPLGGYSLPWADENGEYIVYFNANGSLNEQMVNDIAHDISWNGANSVREFPFWINSKEAYQVLWSMNKYEENWKKIAGYYSKYAVKLWFCLFDHCGLRKNPWNPWVIKYGEEAFYSEKAKAERHQFVDMMLGVMSANGGNMGFELCNEPRLPFCTGEFLADTFVYLILKGVPPENIILGIEYNLKESDPEYSKLYRDFRNLVVEKLKDERWSRWLKDRCISPIHGANMNGIKKVLGPNPPVGGTRNLLWSLDGVKNPRPDALEVNEVVFYLWYRKQNSAMKGKHHWESIRGKQIGDPLDSALGITEVYKEFFGKWPENYRKHEKIPVLSMPEPNINITSPSSNETWKSGKSYNITWTSIGIVGDVKIEYSINNGASWIIITPSAGNDGIHPWLVPDIATRQCLIKVSEVDGDPADIQAVIIKKAAKKPKNKKNKTILYSIGAAIAIIVVFCFIKFPVITALVLVVLLLFVGYFGYRKKIKFKGNG